MHIQTLRDLSVGQLQRAATIKRRIDELERELTSLLGNADDIRTGRTGRRRRKVSAAGRARMAAAAKARWAKVKAKKRV